MAKERESIVHSFIEALNSKTILRKNGKVNEADEKKPKGGRSREDLRCGKMSNPRKIWNDTILKKECP